MKIAYLDLLKNIKSNPSAEELSKKLFQLGHEHEFIEGIFDIEFTPNRGDCLSVQGLLKDLSIFYDLEKDLDIYTDEIECFDFKFFNNAKNYCNAISFMQLEIEETPREYKGSLKGYFENLNNKKNNFFTDVSNFISYQTGQPTHCYDFSKINCPISLGFLNKNSEFETLLNNKILLDKDDLVFFDKDKNIINLAGIIGGKNSACEKNTKSVIIECAYFDPEIIIGKTVKYDINSDAAYKFERNTDASRHDYVLRKFLRIVEENAEIKNIHIYKENNALPDEKSIFFDYKKINKILGININYEECSAYLHKLGFSIKKDKLEIPSYRNDITSINDISEEIARAIGYDNIVNAPFELPFKNINNFKQNESSLKRLLIDNGFYEVINEPFESELKKHSIIVDNPLDSNRKYLRTNLKNSLIGNLLYNERRQKDCIKLFEISDIYSSQTTSSRRVCGLIASGRVGKNYKNFTKKIDYNYIEELIMVINDGQLDITEVAREKLDSKIKTPIFYLEFEIDEFTKIDYPLNNPLNFSLDHKYEIVSELPCSIRDLSFSIRNFSQSKPLQNFLLNFHHEILKEIFVFDYFLNKKNDEIKIGFRFIFQSNKETIKDSEVNSVMNNIIEQSIRFDSVTIPGLK